MNLYIHINLRFDTLLGIAKKDILNRLAGLPPHIHILAAPSASVCVLLY